MTTTTDETTAPRGKALPWPDGYLGISLALGATGEGLAEDENCYIDNTKVGLYFLDMALREWADGDGEAGEAVMDILDRLTRELRMFRAVAEREHELRQAHAAV